MSSQERSPGKPATFEIKGKKAERTGKLTPQDSIPIVFLPAYTNERLQARADSLMKTREVHYYGKGFPVKFDLVKDGCLDRVNNTNIYRVRVKAEHAKGLQFYFGKFHLTRRSKLFLYSYSREKMHGAYTSKNNLKIRAKPGAIEMSTVPLEGNDWILELNVPSNVPQGELAIESVTHIF